ncbi:MAG: formate dehydrogenase subunit delta [Gammaproteobacteria bacterium]|nr:formate dehydrogenase subunit delta [Gammaproteobacteria bacterium]
MHIERLVEMANDIAANQAADPDHAVGIITLHLQRFWDPRMRAQIIAHLAEGGAGLADDARAAIARLTGQ